MKNSDEGVLSFLDECMDELQSIAMNELEEIEPSPLTKEHMSGVWGVIKHSSSSIPDTLQAIESHISYVGPHDASCRLKGAIRVHLVRLYALIVSTKAIQEYAQ